MSKSLGNVLLVHDMINDGVAGEAIRFSLLSTHYRQPFDWTQDGLDHAVKTLNKWYDIIDQTKQGAAPHPIVVDALSDDLNTPLAISTLHQIAKDTPESLQASAAVMGLLQNAQEWFAQKTRYVDEKKVEDLIAQRAQAKMDKDFARADTIRDELDAMGVQIKDSREGTTWSI